MSIVTISKLVSANDTGETGGHQSGILVPKDPKLLSFFPILDSNSLNPRAHLTFTDSSEEKWEFAFIYYNNRKFGGTRNEYRLTRMTKYIRQTGIVAGDEVVLTRDDNYHYSIDFRRSNEVEPPKNNILRLGSGWRIINI